MFTGCAIDQLEMLGKQLDIPVYADRGAGGVKIAGDAIGFARKNIRDTVIIDTAGRCMSMKNDEGEKLCAISQAS